MFGKVREKLEILCIELLFRRCLSFYIQATFVKALKVLKKRVLRVQKKIFFLNTYEVGVGKKKIFINEISRFAFYTPHRLRRFPSFNWKSGESRYILIWGGEKKIEDEKF